MTVAPAPAILRFTDPRKIKIPGFFTTGTHDTVVPAAGVQTAYKEDPQKDKIFINGEGLIHNDMCN